MRKVGILFHADAYSGAEKIALQWARGLSDKFEFVAIGPASRSLASAAESQDVRYIAARFPPALFNRAPLGRMIANATALLSANREIARIARALGLELIHANSFQSVLLSLAASRHRPIVWHCHTIPRRGDALDRYTAKLAGTRAKAIISVSAAVSQYLRAAGIREEKIITVQNAYFCIHRPAGPERPIRHLVRPGRPVVAIIGALTEWKGQHLFLDACEILLQRGANMTALIVGGPLSAGDEAYAHRLSTRIANSPWLSGHAYMTGFVPSVEDVLPDVDILVNASTSPDPYPTILLEGAFAARAMIGPRAGGVPEILSFGSMPTFSPGDAYSLAHGIGELLLDPERRRTMGITAREAYAAFRTKPPPLAEAYNQAFESRRRK